jgi:apolipoprotein D and lipocalin family protein
MIRCIMIILTAMNLLSCKTAKDLTIVKVVDINKYAGQWYEIARLPNKFEKSLECVTAKYTVIENGKIEVLNQGHVAANKAKVKKARGIAWIPDTNYQGRLKVRFFWPFSGDYYIISLDENYNYALVGAPSKKYLWILARTKNLDTKIYSELLDIAKTKGFRTENIIKVNQDCD